MRINQINSAGASPTNSPVPRNGERLDFASALRQTISGLAETQVAADAAAQSIALGDLAKLDEAMLALQRASLALELAVTIRNHAVQGVNELLRVQV